MDETGIVRVLKLSKLKLLCGNHDPECWGVVLSEGTLYIGPVKAGKTLLVSLEAIEHKRDEDEDLSSLPDEEVVMLSWVKTVDPVTVEWHLFAMEDVLQMEQEPDEGMATN